MKKNLRIAINAQIPSASGSGGLETVLRVLTSLGQLEGDEEYIFIGHWADSDWLKPLLSEGQTIISAPPPKKIQSSKTEPLKRLIRPFTRNIKNFISQKKIQPNISHSDGFYESLNCDVIHFPYQDYVLCNVPTVYNPHDLQHLHYPKFFTSEEIERREVIYPAACRAADTVVVASQFVKQDVIDKYIIEADKVQVIPWSPPQIELNERTEKDVENLLEKYECPPQPFMLYPAMTWEHKNHIRLLEALALVRDKFGLKINLICTGYKNDFYSQIENRLSELKLEDQVKFTGIVEYEELSLLYRQAQFVIVPTLFEAASGPLFEAWQHGVAVACSAVTSLPEQAAGAALLFNPLSVEEIANSIKKLASDDKLRAEFCSLGHKRIKTFDVMRTAKAYRAVYRRAADVELTEEDRHLLDWDWMSDSNSRILEESNEY